MNAQSPYRTWLASLFKRFIQFPAQIIRFVGTTVVPRKKEGIPMKTQGQFRTRLMNVFRGSLRPKSRGQVLIRVLVIGVVLALAIVPFWRVFAYSFIVNSTADRVDSNPGDGICRTSANTCTLRAAIQEANASPGLDDIYVPAGVYSITIPPMNDNFIDNGDFDITDSVVIDGAGAGATIIDGGTPPAGLAPEVRGLDRLIEIHPGVDEVTITDLTIREGYTAESGGGIQFGSELVDVSGLPVPITGTLRLENVSIIDNYAAKYGGGINSTGRGLLQLVGSTLTGNGATEGGAAINNGSAGTVEILDGSLIYENPGLVIPDPTNPNYLILVNPADYPLGPGAVNNQAENDLIGTIRVIDSTIRDNAAEDNGAGIHNTRDGIIFVENSTISGNISEANGGGLYTTSGDVTIIGSTFSDNKAAEGGAMYSDGELTKAGLPNHFEVTNSTVTNNVAHANGGGIVSGGETFFTMTNVNVTDNQAHAQGGGVINRGRSSLDVVGGVFSGNDAAEDGGALLLNSERGTTITGTIFTDNHAGVLALTEDPIFGETEGGGGGLYTDGKGAVTLTNATFETNTAHGQGGGIAIHSFGNVTITDSLVNNNDALGEDGTGGGIENSGYLVIFERLTVTNNSATSDGGGIHNSSSGEFTVLDTAISNNVALNGGGFTNASDSTLVVRRTLFWNNRAKLGFGEDAEETGYGGGLYSISDGGGLIENSTFSGNTADTKGGGIYNNADGALRVVNATIWRNSAPSGGGVAVMSSDAVPTIPPTPPTGLILRNSIVSGSIRGGGCDGAVRSEGGNIDEGSVCFTYMPTSSDIVPIGDRMNTTPALDALADNGGHTLTHAFSSGDSIGIDGGVSTVTNTAGIVMPACPETDARGVTRPQHLACDVGAYEHDGPLGPPDTEDPDTEFLGMATDDTTGEQLLFRFTGTDNMTIPSELTFQCRLLEFDPTEPVEPTAPGEPLPIELQFRSCSSPYAVPAVEEGLFTFEVFAIDRAGNQDDTPAVHIFTMNDFNPPETLIVEYPPSTTTSHNATFSFTAIDDFTPPNLHEFECRLDSNDPELWLECTNPTVFSNLAPGSHTLFVRATDLSDNMDPSPAIWTWTVAEPTSCDESNINLIAVADGWVDQVNPAEAYASMTELTVRSGLEGTAPGNARAFFRFSIPTEAAGCDLESATLRLYAGGGTEGRMIEAIPLAAPWSESTLTWSNQPGTTGTASSTVASGNDGYMEWDVLSQVSAGIATNGFQIRDAVESDPEGGDQSFLSRETAQDPPPVTLPQLVLRYEASGDTPPAPPVQPTVPTAVSCGQVLTESTLVANDLTCLGEGLIIGAPNIMLDLNGHTLMSGLVIEPGEEDGLHAGVRNSGHANVIIRNGTIRNYGYGVRLLGGAKYNVVEDMEFIGGIIAGVELFDADDGRNGNIIRDNYFFGNGENGVAIVSGSENSVVLNNTFEGNGGVAILIQESNGHLIEGNDISGISADPLIGADAGIMLVSASDNVLLNNSIYDTGDAGVSLSDRSNRNHIEGNTIVRGSDAGITIADSDGNEVIDNIAHQNGGAGIGLHGNNSIVRGNDVRYNPGGIEIGGSNNLIENNNVSFTKSSGISIETGLGNQLLDNIANDNLGSGIAVETDALDGAGNPIPGNLIWGNTTNGNLGDGISAGGGHNIKENNAHNNMGFGIIGAEGVVDGGGNMASGNAEVVQCVNVVCTSTGNVPLTPPDFTAPETIITFSPPLLSTSVSASFRFDGTDNTVPSTALIYECRLDPPPDPPLPPTDPEEPPEPPQPGDTPTPPAPPEVVDPTDPESWTECMSPTYYLSLDAGAHHFEVRAYDQAGNFDLTPATFDWVIEPMPDGSGADTVAPNTSLREFPSDPSTSTTATFRFVGSDNSTPGPDLDFMCQLNGSGYAPCNSPQTYTGLGVATHTFEVYAVDRSGNEDLTPATYTWEIVAPAADTSAPGTLILSAPDPVTIDTTATFTFSSTETGSTFECSLDGATFTACTSPISYTGLSVAPHTFEVFATDAAGNDDLTPALHSWTIQPAPVSITVFCGQTVTQSIRLLNDLVDCPVYGLLVGADNITVDLNGRILDGVGIGIGILNRGYDSVTITNGSVREFDNGIQLDPGSANNIISGMTLEINQVAGILLRDADDDTLAGGYRGAIIRNNNIINNDLGIALDQDTQDALVHNNSIGGNTEHAVYVQSSSANRIENNLVSESSGAGVMLVGSNNNTVIRNTLLTNDGGGIVAEAGIPFIIEASVPAEFEPPEPPIEPEFGVPANSNRIEENILEQGGILIIGSNNSQILDNSVSESEFGIRMELAHNSLLLGNDVRGNSAGIALYGSTGNRLESNNASEISGSGIALQSLSLNNQLVLNTASFNDSDGISVSDAAVGGAGNLLDRNTTYNNGNNGIYVAYTGHTLVGNIANDNGNWGIYAAAGAGSQINIDGGGNRAQDNVQLEQCFGVVCNGTGPGTLDAVPPETLILEGPANPTTSSSAQFRFTGTDNISTVVFQCRLDSAVEADFTACTSPRAYSGLGVGAHTFEVRAVDSAGNLDSSPAVYTWTIDPLPAGVAPDTTIDSGPDSTTVNTSATFDFSSNEPGVTFECSLNGAPFTSCTTPVAYSGLPVGANQFQVQATDSESLTDPTPATHNWTITAAPVPANVSCGQLITQSTLVSNDLFNCPADALIVGASNITIDLNGHTIDGIGLGSGILNPQFDSVTITNGTVREFDFGVDLRPGSLFNVLSGLTVTTNQEAGIALSDADNATIRNNDVNTNTMGIVLYAGTRGVQVSENSVTMNAGDGIRLEFADTNRIENNEVGTNDGFGIVIEGAGINTVTGNHLNMNVGGGIAIGAETLPSNDNLLQSNIITGNIGAGILITDSSGNDILDNLSNGSGGAGIALELSSSTLIRGNDVRFNGEGIELSESSNNRIEFNDASGNTGGGITVDVLSFNNEIVMNIASVNGGEGISVVESAPAGQSNLIEGNTANGNGGDGIFVDGAGHILNNNVANFNAGWGMYVPLGATNTGNRAVGNVEPAQCFGIPCDTSGVVPGAPETTILDHPDAVSSSRNARFTYTGLDDTTPLGALLFECRLDSINDLAWVDCEYPQDYFNLTPGIHTFEIRAVDAGLVADPTPASFTWEYVPPAAGVAPDTSIDIAPEPVTPLLEALFTFTSNEPDVSFQCQVDDLPWVGCGPEVDFVFVGYSFYIAEFEDFQIGPHTFRVRAIDIEGNLDPTPATHTWSILGGPITTIESGPAFIPPESPGEPPSGGESQSTTATLTFTSYNEPDSTFYCSLDLAPYEPCDATVTGSLWSVTYTGLTLGEHVFRVFAVSPEGVEEMAPIEYSWEVTVPLVNGAPETTLTLAPPDNSSSTVFAFTGTDDFTPSSLLTFECRLDLSPFVECLSPFNLLELYPVEAFLPGTHIFEVRAIDDTEPTPNIDPTPASYTWMTVADTVEPNTAFLSGPTSPTLLLEAEFTFLASDNATPELLLEVQCSLDGGLWEPCASPLSLIFLPGAHTLQVRSVDLAQNIESTPASWSWSSTLETTIDEGPVTPTTEPVASFSFVSNDPDAAFECSLDGAPFTACESGLTYETIDYGAHELRVRSVSLLAGTEATPAVWTWTRELETTISSGPNTFTFDTFGTFDFVASDPLAAFECSLNGSAFTACASPASYDVEIGLHNFQVRAVLTGGVTDPTPASWTWSRMVQTTILSAPLELNGSTTATFTFSANVPGATFECWMDGVTTACTSGVEYTGLSLGTHFFAVRAATPAGPFGNQWADHEFTIVPLTTITSGPDLTTESTSATFAFSSGVPGIAFLCSLDGSEPHPCVSPVTYENLVSGAHLFTVQAVDTVTEIELLPATYAWTIVDDTEPDTFIDLEPENPSDSTTATFAFSASEPNVNFQCSFNGAAFDVCVSPYTLENLEIGSYTFAVRAVDFTGLVDQTPASYEWDVTADSTPPQTSILTGPPAVIGSDSTVISFSGSDTGTPASELTFECSLDNGVTWEACDSPYEIQDLAPTSYTFQVRAADQAGNVDPTPASRSWTVVLTIPTGFNVFVEIPMPNAANLEPASLTFTQVSSSGTLNFDVLTSPPALPAGYFQLGSVYYDISTTAGYTGPILVCLGFNPADFENPANVRLLHYEGGAWVDVTSSTDPAGIVCAEVTSLSPFAVVEVDPNSLPSNDPEPDTFITAGPPSQTTNYVTTFQFTGQDDNTPALELEFLCTLDGEALGSCSSPADVEVLTDGLHTFTVAAVDADGNVDPTPASHTWTIVDFTAPDSSIDAGPNSETTETSATFEFSAVFEVAEAGATFECSLDGADFSACTSPHTVTGLSNGAHIFLVRAVDFAGNADPTPDIYEWLINAPVDTAAPDTTITYLGTLPSAPGDPQIDLFALSSTEAGVEFECALDGAGFEGCEATLEFEGLAAGSHTLQARAIDLAGNVDATPASYTWSVNGVPETTIDSGPASPDPDAIATFTFSANQAGATFLCSLDGGEAISCSSPYLLVVSVEPVEGPHTLEVQAVSALGAVDETPAAYQWTIGLPPETTITSGPPAAIAPETPVLFTFTGADDYSPVLELEFECSLDGEPFSGCSSPLELDALTEGDHELLVRAVDLANNADPTPASYQWAVHPTPDTTVLTAPAIETDSTEATFTFSSTLDGSTFECSLDGAPFAACVSPATYTDVPFGLHIFQVRAVSPAGVADLEPAEYEWASGDLTPPVTAITSGPPAAPATTTDTSASFTFESETGVTFQCSLDGAPFALCESPRTYSDLAAGAHTFEVHATHQHLIAEPLPTLHEWIVVDVAAPETTIVSGPAPEIGQETPSVFLFSSNEPDVVYECSLNGGPFESCASAPDNTAEFAGLDAGPHTLEVRAVDASLNADASPASYSWTIVGSPFTTITLGPPVAPATTTDTSATFEFTSSQAGATFACALDGGDFLPCSSPATYTDLSYAAHTFEVQATNIFGLVEEPPASYEWTIVLPPPEIAPDTLLAEPRPANPTSETVVTFSFSSDLAGSTFECSLDGSAFAACTSAVEYTALAEGEHVFQVRAVSPEGIRDDTPAIHIWTINLPPETTIASGPAAESMSTTASFTFASNEAAVSFECSLDSALFASCPSPHVFTELADGPHTLLVQARDAEGSVDPTPASYSWTVLAPPETTINSGPLESPDTTTSTSATFSFSSNQAGSTFMCSLDELGFALCTSPVTYTGLAIGDHTFEVQATNTRSQIDPTPAEYEWTIVAPTDTAAPETTITANPPASTTLRDASFSFSASEAGSTFECSLDGAAFATCSSPQSYSSLGYASHTFQVRAIDAVGNVDATAASYTWSVTAPSCGSPVTVSANADAWVDQGSTTSNKGTDSILKVMSKSGNAFRALVRFNLPTAPAGCVVQSATLRLYSASWRTGRTLQALQVNANWTENGVTWANQPTTTGTAVTTTSGSGYRQWNVVALVQAMYSGSNFGFLIRDANENNDAEQQFHSREKGSNMPQLVITFGPAP